METPKTGYQVQSYDVPVKRYCQTLDLRDSPDSFHGYSDLQQLRAPDLPYRRQ